MKQQKNVSALLFGLLAVLQMFLIRYMVDNAPVTGVSMSVLMEVIAVFLFAGVAIWLFSSRALCDGGKKAVVAGSLGYLLFVAIYYDMELNVILLGLSLFGETFVSHAAWGYGVLAVKVILLVAAAGCAVMPPKKPGEPTALQEVVEEAAEAFSMDSKAMEKDVEKAVSDFEDAMEAADPEAGKQDE